MEVAFLKAVHLLLTPLKLMSIWLLSLFSRMFYDADKKGEPIVIKKAMMLTRGTMSLFVLLISFFSLRDYFGWSDNMSIVISGILSFSFREVMDGFLTVVKKGYSIKNLFAKDGGDTVDPSGNDFPDEPEDPNG